MIGGRRQRTVPSIRFHASTLTTQDFGLRIPDLRPTPSDHGKVLLTVARRE